MSINTQLMCDDRLSIRNVVASWPGSAHDSRIFNESSLKTYLERLPPKYHVLVDRGYTLSTYLVTPYTDPKPGAERRFNKAQSSTRMVIERVNGILKRRFPCLSRQLRFTPEKCCVIIVACCVLHNLAVMEKDTWEEEDFEPDPEDPEDAEGSKDEDTAGKAKRSTIVREYFGR